MNTLRREYSKPQRTLFGIARWKVLLIAGLSLVLWGGVAGVVMLVVSTMFKR